MDWIKLQLQRAVKAGKATLRRDFDQEVAKISTLLETLIRDE
jgi:hypothetical protein